MEIPRPDEPEEAEEPDEPVDEKEREEEALSAGWGAALRFFFYLRMSCLFCFC